jgi:hypothetical protein
MHKRGRNTHNTENRVALPAILNRIVDNVMFVSCLYSFRFLHICQAFFHAAEVNEGKSLVKKDLGGKESELEAELLIVARKNK